MPAPKHLLEDDSNSNGSWSSEKKKKRRSRWANDEADKTFIPGMPTSLPADATEDQKQQYLHQCLQVSECHNYAHSCIDRLQIEDASRRLRSGDLGIPANPEERSPSPEPIYNNEGKRMNTREYRTRKALEETRHEKIQQLLLLNSNYKPPADYKPPIIRVNDKVMIPQDDHPEINFVGLLIGPRGNTLKNLEKDTGAKIIIRGKGSVKEGKIGRKDGQPMPGEDEPLHAYITANDPENVKKAVNKIHEIIKEGIEIPEEKNDLRKQQLRELALLNGTLRENDGLQKLRQIAEAQTIVTNQIICTKCGGAGHIARDCVQKTPAELANQQLMATGNSGDLPANTVTVRQDRAKMDSEYMSLMAELGQVAPETLKADLAASMPKSNPAFDSSKAGRFDSKETSHTVSTAPPVSNAPPALSSDYGYGGRRSRFDEFDSSRNSGNSRFGGGNFYNSNNRSRFDQGQPQQMSNRFNQPNRFSSQAPSYNQPPPPGSFQPPSSNFSQAPPPPPSQNSWNNGSGNMNGNQGGGINSNQGMCSNRWGPPSGPPSSHMTSSAPPPNRFGLGAPPPPPTSSWSQPSSAPAPWQSAPIPPWQQASHNNPSAPPPPPLPSGNQNQGYGGYSSTTSLPPPPPPQ